MKLAKINPDDKISTYQNDNGEWVLVVNDDEIILSDENTIATFHLDHNAPPPQRPDPRVVPPDSIRYMLWPKLLPGQEPDIFRKVADWFVKIFKPAKKKPRPDDIPPAIKG